MPGEPSVVTEGMTVPWAIGWLPDGQSALVTQRNDFHVWLAIRSGEKTDVGVVPESEGTGGEGGLMGVAVSPTATTTAAGTEAGEITPHFTGTYGRIRAVTTVDGWPPAPVFQPTGSHRHNRPDRAGPVDNQSSLSNTHDR
jgi:hypothetical protein